MQLIKHHNLILHGYADDTQICGFCQPSHTDDLLESVSVSIDDVSLWMRANRLQLSHLKTEVLRCASARCQYVIPAGPVCIGSTSVLPVSSVQDPGVYIDTDLNMKTHVTNTIGACFSLLCQLCSVWHSLWRHALLTLVRALVVSKSTTASLSLSVFREVCRISCSWQ